MEKILIVFMCICVFHFIRESIKLGMIQTYLQQLIVLNAIANNTSLDDLLKKVDKFDKEQKKRGK
jgi:hypothetical protein